MSLYQRILVPIDGGDTSLLGQSEAIRLAKLTGGTLRFFHVIDDLSFALALDAYAGAPGEWLNDLRRDGRTLLDKAVHAATEAGVKAEGELHESFNEKIADLVAAEATKWGADLIVVGTHGRRGLGRLVMGSGAEGILRMAPAPVLLVRSKPADEAASPVEAPKTTRVRVVTGALDIE